MFITQTSCFLQLFNNLVDSVSRCATRTQNYQPHCLYTTTQGPSEEWNVLITLSDPSYTTPSCYSMLSKATKKIPTCRTTCDSFIQLRPIRDKNDVTKILKCYMAKKKTYIKTPLACSILPVLIRKPVEINGKFKYCFRFHICYIWFQKNATRSKI
jgi:hypothetical protein